MKIYEVGGAVRDSILGIDPVDKDWVVVGSSPEEMIANGFKPIGKDFPVFLHPKTNEEYALARTEKKIGVGYHGFNFHYGKEITLEEDLSRRDLTINAIAKDDKGKLIDPFDGMSDIKNKIFRHVSEAFEEDPLRAIRLARFHTYEHLRNFYIAKETKIMLKKIEKSNEISNLSSNRIWLETEKSLKSSNPNIFFEVLLEFNLHMPYLENLKNCFCNTSNNPLIRWSELQINNAFKLNKNLPIPNTFLHAEELLKKLCVIDLKSNKEELINIIDKIPFKRDEALIKQLIELPNLSKSKLLITKLLDNIKKVDFSILSKFSSEKISREKIKLLNQVVRNLNE